FFALGTAAAVFPIWKDSCDIWCSTAYIASLWLFLRFLRTGSAKQVTGAACCFLIALAFKEMAYTLPFMVALVAWHEGKLDWRSGRDGVRRSSTAIGIFFVL